MFTVHILGPATSFKVSTCRCSGSLSVGQIAGNQGKKEEKRGKKKHDWKTQGEGGERRGGKEKRITDGG